MNLTKRSIPPHVMSLKLIILFLLICYSSAFSFINGLYGYPYQIKTYADLKLVKEGMSSQFILMNDINASESLDDNDSLGFEPIGTENTRFSGNFNGNGYTISNLNIQRPDAEDVGLFGYISLLGSVSDLNLSVTINGYESVGAVAGNNGGTILNCHAFGKVTGRTDIGGITGMNHGTIQYSSSVVEVSGHYNIGGLTGSNHRRIQYSFSSNSAEGIYRVGGLIGSNGQSGTVKDSYSMALVIGSSSVGGLVGSGIGQIDSSYSSGKTVGFNSTGGLQSRKRAIPQMSYWNVETTGQRNSEGGSPLTPQEMLLQSSFEDWNFSTVWTIRDRISYPGLIGMNNAPIGFPDTTDQLTEPFDFTPFLMNDIDIDNSPITVGRYAHYSEVDTVSNMLHVYYIPGKVLPSNDTIWGAPTYIAVTNIQDTIAIATYEELKRIGNQWNYPLNGNYRLVSPINAAQSKNENNQEGFIPIGQKGAGFQGSFHGGGFTISNLTINRPSEKYIGLFGKLDSSAQIDSIGVLGSVIGHEYTGIIAGTNYGSINQSFTSGSATGEYSYTGGISGTNSGSISRSYSSATVTGKFIYTGGITGGNWGAIEDSYSTSNVTGDRMTGGLIGRNNGGTVNYSYSVGRTTGNTDTGGLIGYGSGQVTNSFWNTETSECQSSYQGEPLTTTQLKSFGSSRYWGSRDQWEFRVGQSYPGLKDVNDAPFAFVDDSEPLLPASLDFSHYLTNDIDSEDLNVTIAKYAGFSLINPSIDSLLIYYQVGEELPTGDTLWGGTAVIRTENISIDIATYDELKLIGTHWNYPYNGQFRLSAHINAAPSQSENGGKGFEPIGKKTYFPGFTINTGFSGFFEGASFTISNLYIQRPEENNVGLFKHIKDGATIQNLTLIGTITGKDSVGGLSGTIQDGAFVTGVRIKGSVSGQHKVGGVSAVNDGEITYSSNGATVTGIENIGGLVGRNNTTLSTSYNTGTIYSVGISGGLIGQNNGSLSESYNTGTIQGIGHTGGLAGNNSGTIINSYNTGFVFADTTLDPRIYIGSGGAYSQVSSTFGGLIGFNQNSVQKSYSIGQVSGVPNPPPPLLFDPSSGALVGNNYIPGSLEECYWNSTLTDQSTAGENAESGSTELTTEAMSQSTQYPQWLWNTIWHIVEDESFPGLLAIDDAPVGNRDTVLVLVKHDINLFLENDFDIETGQAHLVAKIDTLYDLLRADTLPWVTFLPLTPRGSVDSLVYRVGENRPLSDTLWGNRVTVLLTQALNNPPIAESVPLETLEDTQLEIEITHFLTYCTDVDGDPMSIEPTLISGPLNGDAIVSNGSLIYTPITDWHGVDTLLYQVSDPEASDTAFIVITVTPVNDLPTLTIVDPIILLEDDSSVVPISNSDAFDRDNDSIYFILETPQGAPYTTIGDTLIPHKDYNGTFSVPVRAVAGNDTSLSVPMTVIVTPVNDLPTVTQATPLSVPEDDTLIILISETDAFDADGDSLGLLLQSTPQSPYTVLGDTIVPEPNYNGTFTVPLRIISGIDTTQTVDLIVTVTPVNDIPTLTQVDTLTVLEDDTLIVPVNRSDAFDSDTDSLSLILEVTPGAQYTVSGDTLIPFSDFNGELTVPVRAISGKDTTQPVLMTVLVTPTPEPPTLTFVTPLTIPEDSSAVLLLSLTDAHDQENDPLSLIISHGPNYTVTDDTITPIENFNGVLSIPICAVSGIDTTQPVPLSLTVTPVNDLPTLTSADTLTLFEDTSIQILTSHTNAYDVDADSLHLLLLHDTNAPYTISGDTLTPNANVNGQMSLDIRAVSRNDTTPTTTMIINVTPVNDLPTFTSVDSQCITQDSILVLNLLMTDAQDLDGDSLHLLIEPGADYTVSNDSLLPYDTFFGVLTVPVYIISGTDTTARQTMIVKVTASDTVLNVSSSSLLSSYHSSIQLSSRESSSEAMLHVPSSSQTSSVSSVATHQSSSSSSQVTTFVSSSIPSSSQISRVSSITVPQELPSSSSVVVSDLDINRHQYFSYTKIINSFNQKDLWVKIPNMSRTLKLYTISGTLLHTSTVTGDRVNLSRFINNGVLILMFE